MAALGIGDIIAVITVATKVLEAAEKVAAIYGSVLAGPKALRRLQQDIEQVQQDLNNLRNAFETSGDIDLDFSLAITRAKETLEEGRNLYEKCESTLSQGRFGAVIWGMKRTKQVENYRGELRHLYTVFFPPIWFHLNNRKPPNTTIAPNPPSSAVEVAAAPECAPEPRAAPPLEEELVPGPEQRLRQQFRINYHLPDPELSIPIKWPGVFEPLQVTLHLNIPSAPQHHQVLTLSSIQIMYRTATTRILHLCSGDPFSPSCPLRVKHIVPSGPAYGSVAWTSTCNSHSATFYTKTVAPTEEPMGHRVVVIDRDGEGNEQHHLYRVSELRYVFPRALPRRRLMELARERDLVDRAEFMALEVTASKLPGDGVIARGQVIRLWRRGGKGLELPEVTMTVLATSLYDGKRHEEWDVTVFAHEVRVLTRGVLRRDSDTVELTGLAAAQGKRGPGNLRIRFESIEEARRFRTRFGETYPRYNNTKSPKVGLSLLRKTSSSASDDDRTLSSELSELGFV